MSESSEEVSKINNLLVIFSFRETPIVFLVSSINLSHDLMNNVHMISYF